MNLMLQPYRKYFDFNGRARRSEYWLFVLFMAMVVIVLEALVAVVALSRQGVSQHGAILGFMAFFLLSMIPLLALKFRRLHDTGRSAWWLLIGLVPALGALVLLVFFLLDGTAGPNRYGPDPKRRGATAGDAATAFS